MPGRRTTTVIVVAGCLIALVTYGLRTSFGLFIDPLVDLRGYDREAFALAIGLQNLMWGVGQPFAGAIADRYGAGRVLAVGGVMYAAGTVLMAVSTNAATLSLTGGVLLGLGLSGASFTIVLASFARLVPPERRTWAMGLATAAGSLGQFLFAPLGQAFIGAYGAVTALLLLSCFIALVPLLARALTLQRDRRLQRGAARRHPQQAPAADRRVRRCLAGRRGRRGHGHLRSHVVDLDRAQPGRRGGASPDPRTPCPAVGAERGMSARRHVLVALLLTIAATGGAAWQATAATGSDSATSSLRLVCPLH